MAEPGDGGRDMAVPDLFSGGRYSQRPCGASHSRPTIDRTIGSTRSSVGNATNQDRPQEVIHICGSSVRKPILRAVEISETMKVISSDRTSGLTIAA